VSFNINDFNNESFLLSHYTMMIARLLAAAVLPYCALSFTVATGGLHSVTRLRSSLVPEYEIERLPLRIGHGFDIHRMAPIEDAGQPIVIGGVVIDHVDQKVGGAV
jgi:2-C-methyl-D-erythritol 2,4-cyclodiphosphate synthase